MGLMLKYQRNGQLRRQWYGVYTESNGTRKVVNLNVRWQGTPPASGRVGDQGDRDFEDSRRDAEDALAVHQGKARRKGRVEHLTERLIESKTGRTVQYARIEELAARWRGLGRESAAGEAHLGNCDAHFKRFVAFMQAQNRKAQFLYEVTPEDTAAFARELGRLLAPATKQYGIRLLRKAFTRFLPVGCANPFEDLVGRRGGGDNGVIHRKPFTPEELHALIETARGDEFMYPLIVTAACTGMRRGDVCRLRWRDVNLPGGMLTVKTSKTGGDVEIPIFGPLRDVLATRRGKGLVFPEAAALLKENPDALTWRFKKVVARALDDHAPEELPVRIPAVEVEQEGLAAIREHVAEGPRRDRMENILRRYAAGASIREIEKAIGCSRSTVSLDLEAVAQWTGKSFTRRGAGRHSETSMTAAVARLTRVEREKGQKAGSVRDWHALRTTFVTLALSAGVPTELVRRVTGHRTVEVVMEHYFRPDREQFKAALLGAMPKVLTGEKAALKPAEELAALAGKLAAGTASEDDKARFRKLAAKV